jgi:hypothetical protein
VHDNSGPIIRETRVPVYDKTGPDRWAHGAIGQNAMALYTLLNAGFPSREPVMSILADGLIRLVDDYGAPDNTWDLAWLTAALSRWPGDAGKEAATACASKLLDGQILEGEARGLWGPACINIPLLAAAYLHEQDLAGRQTKAALSAKEKPDNRTRALAASDAASNLLFFQRNMKRIAMLAMAFDEVDAPFIDIGDDEFLKIRTAGLSHYIFNQTAADLESTSLALFALREAFEAKRMPKETWRPKMEGALGVPRPEQADAILARTANVLARLQTRTGDWHACNIHQPVTAFNKMAKMLPGLPVDPKSFIPLPSPQTPMATFQGYAAFNEIGRVVGFEKALGRFRPNFAAGLAAARRQVAALPDRPAKFAVGGRVDPYEAYFFAVAACDEPGTRRRELTGEWSRMAYELVSSQYTNGAWQVTGGARIVPTSMQARMDALPKRDPADRKTIMNRGVAHVSYNWWQGHYNEAYAANRSVLATCHALMFLTTGGHPPFLKATLAREPMTTHVPDIVLGELAESTGVSWRYATVDLATEDPLLGMTAPALFLNGTAEGLGDAALRIRLSNYVLGGGIVIVLSDAANAGQSFLDAVAPVIAVGCGGSATMHDVSGEQAVLGDLAGRLGRPLMGMTRADGSLAALMLLMADQPMPATGAFSAPEAARVISTALQRNLGDTLLTPAYVHQLGDLGDPATLLATAMGMLRASAQRNADASAADAVPDKPDAAAPPPAAQPTAAQPTETPKAAPAAKPAPTPAATPAPKVAQPEVEAEPAKPAPPPPPEPPKPPSVDEVW